MKQLITSVLISFLLTIPLYSDDLKTPHNNKRSDEHARVVKRVVNPEQQQSYTTLKTNNRLEDKTIRPFAFHSTHSAFHVEVDSSINGYGWLNPSIKGIDRYASDGFLLLGYRDYKIGSEDSGILGAVSLDVSEGLESAQTNDDIFQYTELNAAISENTIGARYPGAIALDLPFIHFNQYVSGDANTTPAISHPYVISDYLEGYGFNGGDWTEPHRMDEGYQHHDVTDGNRLWNGPVTIVKDAGGTYHYAAIYSNWFLDSEGQQNDYVVLNASTDDPVFTGWDIDTDPTVVDTNEVTLLSPTIAMNSNGFGVIAGAGNLGQLDSLFYDTLRITYLTTNDYGVTWSEPAVVSPEEMGIPSYVNAEDSLILYLEYEEDDTTLVSYDGPTKTWIQSDMDAFVGEDNTIYIGANIFWGRPSGKHGIYVSPYYSGQHVAMYDAGTETWSGSQIAFLNGSFEGDEFFEGQFAYFWGSEIDIAMDDQNNLYAAWLDRRRTEIEMGDAPRYVSTIDGGQADYKTDIYVSQSVDGGQVWSEPINVTDTPSKDEYELNMVREVSSSNGGTVHLAYYIPNITDETPASGDAYVDYVNHLWVAEASMMTTEVGENFAQSKPTTFRLEQNYPNPFNPATTIRFTAHNSGDALLEVFNVSGKKIKTLFDGRVIEGKEYRFDFNGNGLASGVYFYRLNLANKTAIRKMALIK